MPGLFQGANAIDDIKLGSSQVDAVYVGTELVFPIVTVELVGAVTDSIGLGNIFLDLTGIPLQAGDILVSALSQDTHDAHSIQPAQEIEVYKDIADLPMNSLHLDTLDGTETQIEYRTITTNAESTAVVAVFRGFVTSGFRFVRIEGASGTPNPPALTGIAPSSIVLAIAHLDDDGTTLTAPTGYTMAGSIGIGSGTSGSSCAIAFKFNPSSTEDPDNFGGTSDQWAAVTLELLAL